VPHTLVQSRPGTPLGVGQGIRWLRSLSEGLIAMLTNHNHYVLCEDCFGVTDYRMNYKQTFLLGRSVLPNSYLRPVAMSPLDAGNMIVRINQRLSFIRWRPGTGLFRRKTSELARAIRSATCVFAWRNIWAPDLAPPNPDRSCRILKTREDCRLSSPIF